MKDQKDPNSFQRQVADSEPGADLQETRRSVLRRMVAAAATFATGLFFANRANASNCCTCEWPPLGTHCLEPSGLCYDNVQQDYVNINVIYPGPPNPVCCLEHWGGPVCSYYCTPTHAC